MNSRTQRRIAKVWFIPLCLIVVGVFVWGLQYKLSLYDSPGTPPRCVAQAKLLSPNERASLVQSAEQLCPHLPPSLPLPLLLPLAVAVLFLQFSRPELPDVQESVPGIFISPTSITFRPPPAIALV